MKRTPLARIEARERDLVVYVEGADPIVIDLRPDLADVDELASAFSKVFASGRLRTVRSVDIVLHEPLVESKTLVDLPALRDDDLVSVATDQQARSFRAVNERTAVAVEWVRSAGGSVAIVASTDLRLLERLEESLARNGRSVRQFLPLRGVATPGRTLPTAGAFVLDRRRRAGLTVPAMSTLAQTTTRDTLPH